MAAGYPNYGLLDTMASGIREGMTAYQTTQNMKRQNDMMGLVHGIEQGPDGMQYTAQKLAEMDLEKKQKEGILAQQQLAQQKSDYELGLLREQNTPGNEKATAQQGLIQSVMGNKLQVPGGMSVADYEKNLPLFNHKLSSDKQSPYAEMANLRNIETVHQRALDAVSKDKTTLQYMTTAQNLAQAKNNFQQGGATPQEFNELQQAVRSNLGLKGSGGVGEREETYLKSLGINVAKAEQFVTGNPQSVLESDPKFAEQIMGLVDLEIAGKKKYAAEQIKKNASQHAIFYQNRGKMYQPDFQNVVDQQYGQMGLDNKGNPLKQEGSSGLLNQGGMSPDVLDYAKAHNISPAQALSIKQARGGK